jgi:hypothetical protein
MCRIPIRLRLRSRVDKEEKEKRAHVTLVPDIQSEDARLATAAKGPSVAIS